jgi:hypothetical protein
VEKILKNFFEKIKEKDCGKDFEVIYVKKSRKIFVEKILEIFLCENLRKNFWKRF